jgi:ABC-type antimicrobial peptide transport system permease subunit
MSLGADRATVLRMFLQQGFRLVGIGIVAGALASFATGRVLGQLLIETPVWDPVSFGLALPLLAAVGLAASWLPARRAARIHPIDALRND